MVLLWVRLSFSSNPYLYAKVKKYDMTNHALNFNFRSKISRWDFFLRIDVRFGEKHELMIWNWSQFQIPSRGHTDFCWQCSWRHVLKMLCIQTKTSRVTDKQLILEEPTRDIDFIYTKHGVTSKEMTSLGFTTG